MWECRIGLGNSTWVCWLGWWLESILDFFSLGIVLFIRNHLFSFRVDFVIMDWPLRLGRVLFILALFIGDTLLVLLNNCLVIFIGDCRKR